MIFPAENSSAEISIARKFYLDLLHSFYHEKDDIQNENTDKLESFMHKYVITDGEGGGLKGALNNFRLDQATKFLQIEETDQARVEFCTLFFVIKALLEFL